MISDPLWLEMSESGMLDGNPVELLNEVGSTNDLALELAGKGASAYSLVVAESQTGGRGRLGRVWRSPAGSGLYFSMIVRPRLDPGDLAKITLAAGVAVCSAVEKISGFSLLIKWPNDIILDGRKLGGILSEAVGLQNKNSGAAVIVGIGLNVNTPKEAFPDDLQEKAVSLLSLSGKEYPRGEILAEIVKETKKVIERLEKDGFAQILDEWSQRDATLGKDLCWVTPKGDLVRGISLGPDPSGQLMIRDDQGIVHEVLSGDINLARAGD